MLRSGELMIGAESIKIFARDRERVFELVQKIPEEVLCACVVPTLGGGDSQVVTGSMKGFITVWDTSAEASGKWNAVARCEAHSRSVWSLCYVRDVNRVASGAADNTIKIWSTETWECERELRNHSGWVVGLSSGPR